MAASLSADIGKTRRDGGTTACRQTKNGLSAHWLSGAVDPYRSQKNGGTGGKATKGAAGDAGKGFDTQGADPPPLYVAMAGKKNLNEEIDPHPPLHQG